MRSMPIYQYIGYLSQKYYRIGVAAHYIPPINDMVYSDISVPIPALTTVIKVGFRTKKLQRSDYVPFRIKARISKKAILK